MYGYTKSAWLFLLPIYVYFVYLRKSKGHLDLCLALFLSYHFAIWP